MKYELHIGCAFAVISVAVSLVTSRIEALIVPAIFAAAFIGIWLGRMIYAPDEVRFPQAFKSLTWEEIVERRRKSGERVKG
ncbi:MAG: hypothetical protein N3A02_06960 [Rectinema sp.]|nr:hypothetical protein [Rectinema sp.]